MTTSTTLGNLDYWEPGIPDIINEAPAFQWIDEISNLKCNWIKDVKRNSTVNWFFRDNEENFNKLKLNPPHNDWNFTKDNVNYTYNSLGYRGDEPSLPSDFTILVCGASNSFGTGLDDTQIWPYKLKQQFKTTIKNPKLINLSVVGAPNDFITRLVTRSINTIKPDLVIVSFTWLNWGETIKDDGTIIHSKIVSNQSAGLDSFPVKYNFIKNHNMIKLACNKTKLICTGVNEWKPLHKKVKEKIGREDLARDGTHFGEIVHNEFATSIYNSAIKLL